MLILVVGKSQKLTVVERTENNSINVENKLVDSILSKSTLGLPATSNSTEAASLGFLLGWSLWIVVQALRSAALSNKSKKSESGCWIKPLIF